MSTSSKAYDCALRLLSRREHGAAELLTKLRQKGYGKIEAEEALARCQESGYQCDSRFAGSLLRTRIQQGYGPLRIRQDMQSVGLAADLIADLLQAEAEHWLGRAQTVWQKKASHMETLDFEGQQKLQRFLYGRGFSVDVIRKVNIKQL